MSIDIVKLGEHSSMQHSIGNQFSDERSPDGVGYLLIEIGCLDKRIEFTYAFGHGRYCVCV